MIFPQRAAPVLFGFLLAGFMTLIVSGLVTSLNVGLPPDFLRRWMSAWALTWAIAFPVVLVVRPAVARLVTLLTIPRQADSSSPR